MAPQPHASLQSLHTYATAYRARLSPPGASNDNRASNSTVVVAFPNDLRTLVEALARVQEERDHFARSNKGTRP